MNLFSSNLIKLQHIRQRNQAEEIQRKIQKDLEFLKDLISRPVSQQSEKIFVSRANSAAFKDQEFLMDEYFNKYFEELNIKNQQNNNNNRCQTSNSPNKTLTSINQPKEKWIENENQNRYKLRSRSLNQEKERLGLGEIFRLQDKIEEIVSKNQQKKSNRLRRVLSESDFYALKKLNFSNYSFVKIKKQNVQMGDYQDKNTMMIDEMSTSYKYIYKLSKKFCNIDKEMTEKVSQKIKEKAIQKKQQEDENIMEKNTTVNVSKKKNYSSLLDFIINYKPLDPVHRKQQILKKLSDFNLKRRQQSSENIQKTRLSRINSDYINLNINQSAHIYEKQKEQINENASSNNHEIYDKEKMSPKKRSLSSKSLANPMDLNPQKHFLQKINKQSSIKFLVKPNTLNSKLQTEDQNNEINKNSQKIQSNENNPFAIQNLNNLQKINSKHTDKLKNKNTSFLQTLKNIDLSQSFQLNTMIPTNEVQYQKIEKEQKTNINNHNDSPLKAYTLFQNKNLRQKIQLQNHNSKPKYLEPRETQTDLNFLKYLNQNVQTEQDYLREDQSNEGNNQIQLQPLKRKSIDSNILLKIRNDNSIKEIILKTIIREKLDLKIIFSQNYSLNDNFIQDVIKFYAKLVMRGNDKISTTQFYEFLYQIFQYQSTSQQQNTSDNLQNDDIALNITKQIILKYPTCINEQLNEGQIKKFFTQNLQIAEIIREKLFL